MGFDKALLMISGVPMAARLASLLARVATPTVEVGPGRSPLAHVSEEPPGSGPLAALCAGATALAAGGFDGPLLVIACDMPLLTEPVLSTIAGWPGPASAVPRVRGVLQPLCARWSPHDLHLAAELVSEGERAMKSLLAVASFEEVGEQDWPSGTSAEVFGDVDSPDDLRRLGMRSLRVEGGGAEGVEGGGRFGV